MYRKTLIISPCCATKLYRCKDELSPKDFLSNKILEERTREFLLRHPNMHCRAIEMYTGQIYGKKEKPKSFRKCIKIIEENNMNVDYRIFSAGYGIISHDKDIVPYDVTFANKNGSNLNFEKVKRECGVRTKREWGDIRNARKDFESLIKEYDLVILLLSIDYMEGIGMDYEKYTLKKDGRMIVFTNDNEKNIEGISFIRLDNKRYGGHNTTVRADMLLGILETAIKENPNDPIEYIYNNYRDYDLLNKTIISF